MILVASYCRVSTDKDDQTNSFEAQQRYFKEYIGRQPDWEYYIESMQTRASPAQARKSESSSIV